MEHREENYGKKGSKEIIHVVYWGIIVLTVVIAAGIGFGVGAAESEYLAALKVIWDNAVPITVSIVCSVLASIIYAYIMNRISKAENNEFKNEIKRELELVIDEIYDKKIADGTGKIVQEISEVYKNTADLIPFRSYKSSNKPNNEFNAYLNSKISDSHRFVYFGASATFTCYRLHELKRQMPDKVNLDIEIYIADPSNKEIFNNSEKFIWVKEQNRDPASKRDMQTIIREEKKNILACLSALEEMAGDFNDINVYMVSHLPFINIEMTDDMIVLEFFRTRENYRRYPLSIIYEGKKTLYEGYEFYLEWEREKAKHIKKSELTPEYIKKLGKDAGLGVLTDKQLKEYRNKRILSKEKPK